jgi:hypothetical protein
MSKPLASKASFSPRLSRMALGRNWISKVSTEMPKPFQITAVFLLLAIPAVQHGQELGISRFYLDYVVVQNSLMAGKGFFDELMNLAKLDRQSADFLAEFWWSKAKKECYDFVEKTARRYAEKITPKSSNAEIKQVEVQMMDEVNQCYHSVYYDHWEEINRMIKANYEAAVKKSKK